MLSNFLLLLFIAGVVLGGGACLVGLVTPGWYKDPVTPGEEEWKGLVECLKNPEDPNNPCWVYWKAQPEALKATIALILIGLLASVAALAWVLVVCFACCCKSCVGPPLPILMTLAFLCQLIACIVYGVKIYKGDFTAGGVVKHPVDTLGWSFALSIAGTVIYFVDILLGVLVVIFGSV